MPLSRLWLRRAVSQGVQTVAASVDTAAVASAVASAMSGWQPMVQVGSSTLYGEMVRAGKAQRAPFVTRRS